MYSGRHFGSATNALGTKRLTVVLAAVLCFFAATQLFAPTTGHAQGPNLPSPAAPPTLPIPPAPSGSTSAAVLEKRVVVIPIEDMVSQWMLYLVRNGVKEANAINADAIVLKIDTDGGELSNMREIVRELDTAPMPVLAFIANRAYSAGAIIAMCADRIYMADNSDIGDAIILVVSKLGGTLQTIDPHTREKMTAPLDTFARTYSQKAGHDPDIVSAMIRPERELVFDGQIVCPQNMVLTLNNRDAAKYYTINGSRRPIISQGTVADLNDVLQRENLGAAKVTMTEVRMAFRFAKWIQMFAPIIAIIGLFLIFKEIQAPGFGAAGLLGALCFFFLFWGFNVAGLAGWEEVVLFAVGLGLIAAEVFIFPGFGVAGISGLIIVVGSLFMAMVRYYPGSGGLPSQFSDLTWPIATLAIVMVGLLGGFIAMLTWLPESKAFKRRFGMEAATDAASGYIVSDDRLATPGDHGTTRSPLRPSGTAIINNKVYDVMSAGGFIDRDTPIRVLESKGNRIVVETITGDSTATNETT